MPHQSRPVSLLLNVAHGIDHMFLLIFATAVATIAAEFGYAQLGRPDALRVGAFALFGLGSLPAGRLGDLWGRRVDDDHLLRRHRRVRAARRAARRTRGSSPAALTLIGAFAAIYHPVGIPMLVQNVPNPGAVIGVNGLAGNLGIAVAALVTGFLVKWIGWRAAFACRACVAIALRHRVRASCARRRPRRRRKRKRQGRRSCCRPRCWRARSR